MRNAVDGPARAARAKSLETGEPGPACELSVRALKQQGVGLAFGPDVTQRFCEANGITSIIRSHEVRQEGYAIEQGGLCITVFSAPNYCDQTGNKVSLVVPSQHDPAANRKECS